jgi:hypothetical protein
MSSQAQRFGVFAATAVLTATLAQAQQAPAAAAPAKPLPEVSMPKPAPVSATIYGYIKLDASYDSQRTAGGDLMFYVQQETGGEKDAEFNMTARESRFGLALAGPDVGSIRTTGRFEADFYGNAGAANTPVPRLRLAYLDLAGDYGLSLRAGQDWETFILVAPRIINFAFLADAGALGLRRPQVRLTKETDLGGAKLVAKAAAARTIGQDIDGGGQDDGADADYPTFQGNLYLESKLLTDRATKFGVSGHFGSEVMDTVVSNKVVVEDSKTYNTWSIQGNAFLPLASFLTLQGSIWAGENLDTYYGGVGQGVNKTLEKGIKAKGGWVQALVDVTSAWSVNIGYGIDDPDNEDLNAGDRSKNENVFANTYYAVNSAVTLGVEYTYMTTSYKAQDDSPNNRVQGMAMYKF